ncbi:hypothetical protein M405DRAFT_865381 [Rhizopogon salebrosus TDB-379]|nr:hypothetical protein M405DRAFT_865381 [Rhizopogon salebrosus TDB-379]
MSSPNSRTPVDYHGASSRCPLQSVPILVPVAVLSHLQDHVCLLQPAVPFLVPPQTAGAALSDRTLINQQNSGNAQSKLSPLVTCLVVEVPAVGDKQPLYAARLPVRVSDQTKCIKNPTWRIRVFFSPAAFKTLGDTKGRICSQGLIAFQKAIVQRLQIVLNPEMIYATRSRYYGYTYSLVLTAHIVRDGVKKDPLDACLGKLYKDKILLVVVARKRCSRFGTSWADRQTQTCS